MKKALAFGIAAALLVPAGASAHGGYLHRAAAMRAANTYAGAQLGDLFASSGITTVCVRHANRVLGCIVHYENVRALGAGATLDEVVAVVLQRGHILVHSRVFAP